MTTDEILDKAITTMLRRWKREGTTGASVACLKQCTRTSGLTCSMHEYNSRFPVVAADVCRKLNFDLY